MTFETIDFASTRILYTYFIIPTRARQKLRYYIGHRSLFRMLKEGETFAQ